jgi:hypothetical protein
MEFAVHQQQLEHVQTAWHRWEHALLKTLVLKPMPNVSVVNAVL